MKTSIIFRLLCLIFSFFFFSCFSLDNHLNDRIIRNTSEIVIGTIWEITPVPNDNRNMFFMIFLENSRLIVYNARTGNRETRNTWRVSGRNELLLALPTVSGIDNDFWFYATLISPNLMEGTTDSTRIYNRFRGIRLNSIEEMESRRQEFIAPIRQEQLERMNRIRSIIGPGEIITIRHQFDFTNPHGFDRNVIYYFPSDFLYVHQWLDIGFIGSFLPIEANLRMPYNIQFYVRNAYNIQGIRHRVGQTYLRYLGADRFTRANGASIILPMFDLLYYEN